MTSEPAGPAALDEPMDADVARRTAAEMAALTRVLFGVTTRAYAPAELAPPAPEPPVPAPEPSTPVASIPVTQAIPVPPPAAKPAADVPASLPMPGIPLPDIPLAAETAPEPVRETQRRPAGPSPELLQEIAFLEE